MWTRALVVGGFALGIVTGCGDDEIAEDVAGSDCQRNPARVFEIGEVIRIGDVDPPCEIEFRETGVVLLGDPNGTRPDPGRSIVRDSRGRFYTANAQGFPSVISLWNADGEYIKTFSGPGDGPGELSTQGAVTIFVDARDRLHVRDGGPRWSIFDDEQNFSSSVPAPNLGIASGTTILASGSAVTAVNSPGDYHFLILDSTGVVVQRVVPVNPAHRAQAFLYPGRIAATDKNSFWATPAHNQGHSPVGYRLEEWSIEGVLLRAIEREVPWFPTVWPPPPVPTEGTPESLMSRRPAVQVAALYDDGDGILYATVSSPSASWRSMPNEELYGLPDAERRTLYQFRVEMIDTRSGELLVSQVFEGNAYPPTGSFPGTRYAYASGIGDDLLPTISILEYSLVRR